MFAPSERATFSASARWLGVASAGAVVVLLAAYATTLAVGLRALPSPDAPIADPMFTLMEVLILALVPATVGLMAAVHAWAPPSARALTLAALVCTGVLAGLTAAVHFAVLTLSRHPAFAEQAALPLFATFAWPSVVYALDILAWDGFFAGAMLFAAPAFGGSRLARAVRWAMVASGVLALAGFAGVAVGDMGVRNVGILGYVVGFGVVAALLGALFWWAPPAEQALHR